MSFTRTLFPFAPIRGSLQRFHKLNPQEGNEHTKRSEREQEEQVQIYFYNRMTAHKGDFVWQQLPLDPGDRIVDVSIRGSVSMNFLETPSLAMLTLKDRRQTSGPSIAEEKLKHYWYHLMTPLSSIVTRVLLNELSKDDPNLPIGISPEILDPNLATPCANLMRFSVWWTSETVSGAAHSGVDSHWSKVDTSGYDNWLACLDLKQGLEDRIGLRFGLEIR